MNKKLGIMSRRFIVRWVVGLAAVLVPAYGESHPPHAPAPLSNKTACSAPAAESGEAARLLTGMGSYRFQISTRVPDAQRFFDQGLVLAWGFNFAEAERSFRQSSRLDPDCAMCRWGVAYALGPSINHDIDAETAAAAYDAVQEARRLAHTADARERALIEALARRYAPRPRTDGPTLDNAYSRAMGDVARRFPKDADVLSLFAEALMNIHGRDYWRKNGAAQVWTPQIIAVLERALKIAPDHPLANHYYVHVFEDSPHPERARASADRLRTLAPGVGHLVHMPAHVYLRLGDYGAVAAVNEAAIAADRAYLETRCADAKYVSGYVAHNYHFLWASSVMAGRSGAALAAATELQRYVESVAQSGPLSGTQQHFVVLPLFTQARFGRWQAVIAAPRPVAATPYTDGVWHYARAMAYLRGGDVNQARRELQSLEAALSRATPDAAALKETNPLSKLLALSARLLKAELAGATGDRAAAIAHARAAVKLESELAADEPPAWHAPARHTLGALLLEAGRAAAAERVYREDLKIHPANGWALAGLAESVALQRRSAAATAVRSDFTRAWADADVEIHGSRF